MEDYHSEEEEHSEDLSYLDLEEFPSFLDKRTDLKSLKLDHNQITILPRSIGQYINLVSLDISNNGLTYLSDEIVHLHKLKTFVCRNNAMSSECVPKDFGRMQSLLFLNFAGNNFTDFPMQLTEMKNLRCLYLGSNRIQNVPREIKYMQSLEILYLGGNCLTEIPADIGYLGNLSALSLCDNQLQTLPPTLLNLQRLKSLALHNNLIAVLPPQIIALDLVELSLRNNPLVANFVRDMVFEPPSLLELAGRVVKVANLPYMREELPSNLVEYLNMAQKCVNPKCKGVYFSSRWEHVKFVDFCGKYRLPLLQYLCSPNCTPTTPVVSCSSESDEDDVPIRRMKKVLLG